MFQKMKNYKISKKLTISYAVVLILLVLSMLISIINFISIGNQVEAFYEGPFKVSASANLINAKFEQMQKSVFRALSTENRDITDEAIQNAKNASTIISEQLPIIEENFLGDQNIVTRLKEKLTELAPMREEVINLANANENVKAAAYMEENNIPIIKAAQVELDSLISAADQTGEELISDLRAAQTRSIILLSVLGVLSIIISITFAKYITKSITEPVEEMEIATRNLSQGILAYDNIKYESADELGGLAKNLKVSMELLSKMIQDLSFLLEEIAQGNFQAKTTAEQAYVGEFQKLLLSIRQMNNNLSDTLSQINEGSDQVAIGSDQMAQNAQNLAEGATEQAGAVEELNAVIDSVADMAEESAKDTQSALVEVEGSVDKAQEGTQEMEKLTVAMERITETSKEIGNIIAAIEDIASQTNLLSLNASIEAARAGEAGRGFAVVADQIGKLAADSAQSAVNTRQLIEKTLEEIAVGNDIMMKTSQSFAEVIEAMRSFSGIAKVTNQKSIEQSESLQQVRVGIEQISGVVQSNSASAEEASATSEELAAQSDNLKALVSKFRLLEKNS